MFCAGATATRLVGSGAFARLEIEFGAPWTQHDDAHADEPKRTGEQLQTVRPISINVVNPAALPGRRANRS
jgi:hypothetical protein